MVDQYSKGLDFIAVDDFSETSDGFIVVSKSRLLELELLAMATQQPTPETSQFEELISFLNGFRGEMS